VGPSKITATVSNQFGNRLRELRLKQGWTLEQLAAACAVSRSMLSQIERNRANPTLSVACRIAQAFRMTLDRLVGLANVAPRIDVIRDDETYHFRAKKEYHVRTLSPLYLEKDVEFYEVMLQPGGALRSPAHYTGTHELLTVHQGSVRVTSADEQCELQQGDSAHYRVDVAHAIENMGSDKAILFLVVIYREEEK